LYVLKLKAFDEINGADAGWLRARHHFAIGPYGNPAHRPIGNLIVLNNNEIAPHTGFGLHHHTNVEIVSYIREGVVTHRDNQGNQVTHTLRKEDAGYLVPATGQIEVNGVLVRAREGLVIRSEERISIRTVADSELVLIVTAT